MSDDMRKALQDICQRANEGRGDIIALQDAIHAMHGIATAALKATPSRPVSGEAVEALEEIRGVVGQANELLKVAYKGGAWKSKVNSAIWRLKNIDDVAAAAIATLKSAPAVSPQDAKAVAVPAAWGRVIDGQAVTVSREWTRANSDPLYASPVDRAAVIEDCAKVAESFRRWIGGDDYSNAFDKAGIATAIRALALPRAERGAES